MLIGPPANSAKGFYTHGYLFHDLYFYFTPHPYFLLFVHVSPEIQLPVKGVRGQASTLDEGLHVVAERSTGGIARKGRGGGGLTTPIVAVERA